MDHASVKCKTKPLENNIAKKLDDLGHGEDILDLTPRHDPCKKLLINWTSLKLKFSSLYRTMSREWKRQITYWEEIFAKYTSDKELVS